jgi:hypothetical protein
MYREGVANFMHAQQLRARLEAAATADEVAAIAW